MNFPGIKLAAVQSWQQQLTQVYGYTCIYQMDFEQTLSPFIFNLFIDKLPTVYDKTCDGLILVKNKLNCLIWALPKKSFESKENLLKAWETYFQEKKQPKSEAMANNKR